MSLELSTPFSRGSSRRPRESDVAAFANIRGFVIVHAEDSALRSAFVTCLVALRELRDGHIKIVSRYIVVKAHKRQSRAPLESTDLVKRSDDECGGIEMDRLRGTGGTPLMTFLKQTRNDTSCDSSGCRPKGEAMPL